MGVGVAVTLSVPTLVTDDAAADSGGAIFLQPGGRSRRNPEISLDSLVAGVEEVVGLADVDYL